MTLSAKDNRFYREKAMSNARLIAAAPEIIEMLHKAYDAFHYIATLKALPPPAARETAGRHLNEVTALLAKATGEE